MTKPNGATYKIALNPSDPTKPPWRIVSPEGKSRYYNEVTLLVPVATQAEYTGSATPCFKGWMICEGVLEADEVAMTARIV
jgi:hypothetical protein